MKKLLCKAAAALAAAALLAAPCTAADCSAACAIVMDADTGAVLYEKEADRRSLIASTTKIMTAVVVLERCHPDDEFVIPPEAANVEGSSIYLRAGEVLTVRELLYGMLLHSGNDAAVALALACGGSVGEFVALMNLKAQKLGLTNTSFENPSGLDGENHYSTARDLANLTAYALKNDLFRQIVSTKTIRCGERSFTNHNRLLWSTAGVIGVKTGYTKAAGRTLVSAAERNGRRLIIVTLHDGNDWLDHSRLYDDCFARYAETTLVAPDETVATVPLFGGGTATLRAEGGVTGFAAEGETVSIRLLYPRQAFEAGEPGTFAGSAAVYLGERRVAVIRLIWGESEENHEAATAKDPLGARRGVAACG